HTGNENSPSDPFGRTELAIEADGRARLVHFHRGMTRAWTAKIDRAILVTMWAALERGGFPTIPKHSIPGGSALRTLVAHRGDARSGGHIAYHSASELAGYSDAFPILDSLVRQIAEDTIKRTPNTLEP